MNEADYDDIINLPHHVSTIHPQMSKEARASQFAPFAALTGHASAIKEATRLTDKRMEIDEGQKALLNSKIQIIAERIKDKPEVTFTYFLYDNKKEGGKYVSVTGIVKKIDMVGQYIMLVDKTKILIKEIININSQLFISEDYI